ncbi:hypothetical protein L596_030870 [Steinernema carpocapsae]|uniref:RING-type domain-containing protein n=1 Tax=Steinernema carpocapsae TaxID=34508 RepID=A0A4V5ZWS9_STECR|nr:hypothetical protein L596_030870 [Steinernema carpocapsae]
MMAPKKTGTDALQKTTAEGSKKTEGSKRSEGEGSMRNAPKDSKRNTAEGAKKAAAEAVEKALRKAAPERVDHCGLPFEGIPKECIICCKFSDLFGMGACRHPVCIECAVRMRVLAEHKSCPQCRGDIIWTYIVKAPEGEWNDYALPDNFLDHPTDTVEFNIRFDSEYARTSYDRLLSHTCQTCSKGENLVILPTFEALRQHVGQKHKRFFCHICTENMRLFSWERKSYSSDGLQMHMKKGDRDDTSYKGHPACLFCPERFFDFDQQYKHLRKEHFFCQICDSDGISNVFYKKRTELTGHYAKQHFPCQESDCKEMGIVFRTELELSVHKASEHGTSRNRRVIEMSFNRNDRQLGASNRARPTRDHVAQPPMSLPAENPPLRSFSATESHSVTVVTASAAQPAQVVIVPSAQNTNRPLPPAYAARSSNMNFGTSDFPSLAGTVPTSARAPPRQRLIPSLAKPATPSRIVRKPVQSIRPVPVVKVAHNSRRQLEANDDAPSFSGRSSPPPLREAKPKITLIPAASSSLTVKPAPSRIIVGALQSNTQFPSLGSGPAAPTALVQWGKSAPKPTSANAAAKKKKELPKPDLWPDLTPTNGETSRATAPKVASLKDLSALLQANSIQPQESSAQGYESVENESSLTEGKKKKKKGGKAVAVVKLDDLDRMSGRR